jgi:3-deoxy-manno-octulosonate cytidylyltransferase (CMP-KDO synthetase)
MKKKTAIIIPSRYASTRLHAKPLIEVDGKPIIQWVYEKASAVKQADEVIVATDHEEIFDCVKSFGGKVEMTSENHKCGSDRIAEVASRHEEMEYIVNLQGDEPMITPESIDSVITALKNGNNGQEADIATLLRVIEDKDEVNNPNLVKCVKDNNGFALYFSRSKIPFERNENEAVFYGHIGLYGYKREALFKMTALSQTMLEKSESLEQLRALESGMKIITSVVDFKPIGIDTKEDVEEFKKAICNK